MSTPENSNQEAENQEEKDLSFVKNFLLSNELYQEAETKKAFTLPSQDSILEDLEDFLQGEEIFDESYFEFPPNNEEE